MGVEDVTLRYVIPRSITEGRCYLPVDDPEKLLMKASERSQSLSSSLPIEFAFSNILEHRGGGSFRPARCLEFVDFPLQMNIFAYPRVPYVHSMQSCVLKLFANA